MGGVARFYRVVRLVIDLWALGDSSFAEPDNRDTPPSTRGLKENTNVPERSDTRKRL